MSDDYLGTGKKQKTLKELYLESLQLQNTPSPDWTPSMTSYARIEPDATDYTRGPAPLVVPPVPPGYRNMLPTPPPVEPPPIQPPQAAQALPTEAPQRPGRGLLTTIGKGLKAGIGELARGMKLGPEGYRNLNLYKEKLPYEREEFDKQMSMKQATPGYEIDRIKADAYKSWQAGTATDEEKMVIGILPKENPEKAEQQKAALEGTTIAEFTDKTKHTDLNTALRELSKDGALLTAVLGADGYQNLVTKIVGYWRSK